MKKYGPYIRKDGRSHIIWYDEETKKRTTQSYPRHLMEEFLQRPLEPWEQVDHKNNDPSDNRIENLQLLTCLENNQKSFLGTGEVGQFICPNCETKFEIPMRQYRQNQVKRGNAGPYCSRHCAGTVHH